MFGILQQLDLISAARILPPLRSLIPFTALSPIQWPGLIGIGPFCKVLALDSIVPIGLILGYVKARNEIAAWLFAPAYNRVPRPVNISFSNNPSSPLGGEEEVETPEDPPAQLQRQDTMDSTMGVMDEEMEARIGFEFEETTEIAPALAGQAGASASWSAELRSAEPSPITYHITALTALPALLAADGSSLALAEFAAVPLEATMVRVLASAYLRSVGKDNIGMWHNFEFSWTGIINVVTIQVIEVTLIAGVWAGFNIWSEWMGGSTEDDVETKR